MSSILDANAHVVAVRTVCLSELIGLAVCTLASLHPDVANACAIVSAEALPSAAIARTHIHVATTIGTFPAGLTFTNTGERSTSSFQAIYALFATTETFTRRVHVGGTTITGKANEAGLAKARAITRRAVVARQGASSGAGATPSTVCVPIAGLASAGWR